MNLKRCEQAIVKHKQETGRFRIAMQQADALVEELQDALDADAIEEGRLEALKDQLAEAQEDVTTHESSYEESVVAKDKNNDSVRTTRDEMATIDRQIQGAESQVTRAEAKATNCANQRMASLRDKNAALEAVTKEQGEVDKLNVERLDQIGIVENFIRQANEHCARVPVDEGETGDSIERKYEKLQRDLDRAEKR